VSRTSKRNTWARLFALARPEAKSLTLGTLLLVVASSGNLAFPQGIRFVIDEALRGKSQDNIDRAALLMLGVFLVQGVAGAARFVVFTRVGERVVAALREQLFASLLAQEIAFFDKEKTGDLTNRLSADTTVLQNTVSVNISMALRAVAGIIGGLVLLFLTSAKLTGMMLLVVPPVALGAMYYGRRVRGISREVQDALARSTDVAEESIAGVRTVRSFAAEAQEITRFKTAVQASLKLSYRRIRLAATFFGTATFAAYSAGAFVFWFGGRMVLRGELTVGALTSFLIYTLLVAFSLGSLSDLWADFNKAAGASERVFELIERVPAMPAGVGQTLAHIEGRVTFDNVTFAYPARPDVTVLKQFSLTLSPGEIVALVGPSGAGKSTVAQLLYRMYDPQEGNVRLDDTLLTELEPTWLRRQIGVVAQEPLLFSTSIRDNIRYGRPEASDQDVERAAKLANAHEFIAAFPEGYETNVGERGVQLSGGQKQRVAIARAVLKDPKVLVLDEATSALDAESEFHVREALERLMQGRTTLVIAHRLSSVKSANRVVVFEAGAIAETGTHDELMRTGGLYQRLVERQFEGVSVSPASP
jgi:ABC transporter fused permease/ATP-binding protein